jgi:anti-sigma factor RsiW
MTPSGHPDDELLLDHALGLLVSAPRAGVEAHLAGCAACGARAATLAREQEALRTALRSAPDAAAARRVTAGVLVALGQPAAPAARPARRSPWLAAAAVGLVAGALFVFAGGREERRRRQAFVEHVRASETYALGVQGGAK